MQEYFFFFKDQWELLFQNFWGCSQETDLRAVHKNHITLQIPLEVSIGISLMSSITVCLVFG